MALTSLCIWKGSTCPFKPHCHPFQKAFPILTQTALKSPTLLSTIIPHTCFPEYTYHTVMHLLKPSGCALFLFLPQHNACTIARYSIILTTLNQNWINLIHTGQQELKTSFRSKQKLGVAENLGVHRARSTHKGCAKSHKQETPISGWEYQTGRYKSDFSWNNSNI